MLSVCVFFVDVGFEIITIIIRQFPTKRRVSSARDLSFVYSFFADAIFFYLLIEKKYSFRLAYVHYIQEEEKIQMKANTMTCPPVRRMGQAGGQFVAD